MAKTFTASIPTSDLVVPAGGPAQGPYRWTLTGAAEQTQDTAEPTAQFTVEPGDYTLTVQAFAADGSPLGGPSKPATFTIAADTVTVKVVTDGDITITF